MSKQVYNVVRRRESQKEERVFWDKHGIMIIDGDKIRLRLNSFPVGEWDGGFSIYPRDYQDNEAPPNE